MIKPDSYFIGKISVKYDYIMYPVRNSKKHLRTDN